MGFKGRVITAAPYRNKNMFLKIQYLNAGSGFNHAITRSDYRFQTSSPILLIGHFTVVCSAS